MDKQRAALLAVGIAVGAVGHRVAAPPPSTEVAPVELMQRTSGGASMFFLAKNAYGERMRQVDLDASEVRLDGARLPAGDTSFAALQRAVEAFAGAYPAARRVRWTRDAVVVAEGAALLLTIRGDRCSVNDQPWASCPPGVASPVSALVTATRDATKDLADQLGRP